MELEVWLILSLILVLPTLPFITYWAKERTLIEQDQPSLLSWFQPERKSYWSYLNPITWWTPKEPGYVTRLNELANKLPVLIQAFIAVVVLFFILKLLIQIILFVLGFRSDGVAKGSYGSSMMSREAIARGGGVARGGRVARLQSAGTSGGPLALLGTLLPLGIIGALFYLYYDTKSARIKQSAW